MFQDKCVGLTTTDGEATINGSNSGLWKKLKDKFSSLFLTF